MLEKLSTPAFAPLRNESLFESVYVANDGYGIIWNDDIDVSEYELWKNAVKVATIETLIKTAA